jgi:hypothetical protein
MKIRIKKRLNEGKGADIIARGLNVNLLSDNAKKIFNKFGGFEEVMQGDEETINQVLELIISLNFGDKQNLKNDSNVFREFARLSELKVLEAEEEYEKIRNKNLDDYNEFLDIINRGDGPGRRYPDPRNNFFAMHMKYEREQEEEQYLIGIKNLQKEVDKYNNIAEKLLQV